MRSYARILPIALGLAMTTPAVLRAQATTDTVEVLQSAARQIAARSPDGHDAVCVVTGSSVLSLGTAPEDVLGLFVETQPLRDAFMIEIRAVIRGILEIDNAENCDPKARIPLWAEFSTPVFITPDSALVSFSVDQGPHHKSTPTCVVVRVEQENGLSWERIGECYHEAIRPRGSGDP